MPIFAEVLDILFNRISLWVTVLPLSFSFGAGILALLNPCGIALLPAYLALYMRGRDTDTKFQSASLMRATSEVRRALFVSAIVTMSFVSLFGLVALILLSGGHVLIKYFPWLALAMGACLVLLGIIMVTGKSLYTVMGLRLAARINIPETLGIRTFFLFGIAYGIASLSCTLPIFLLVASNAIASGGFLQGLYQFASYLSGMSLILIILTLALAIFKTAAREYLHRIIPYIHRTSAILVILAGLYLICYWLILGDVIS